MNRKYEKNYVYRPGNQEKKPRRSDSSLFYIVLIVLGIILASSYLVLQIRISSVNFEIEMAQNEMDVLEKENRKLRLELAAKTNLREIEQRARRELAMVKPEQQEFVVMSFPERIGEGSEEDGISIAFNWRGLWGGIAEWFQDSSTVTAGALGE